GRERAPSRGVRRSPRSPWEVRSPSVRPRTLAVATAAGGIGLIVATAVLPSVRFAYGNPGLHVAIETTAVIVGSLVAYLAVGRFRRQHRRSDLLVACGLGLLVIGNLALV